MRETDPGEDDGDSWLQDTGLFGSDFAKRVAQEIFVVEVDAGDDGHGGRKNIGGIKSATEADFEHAEFDASSGEVFECHGGDAFEIGGMRAELSIGEELFDQDMNASEGFGEGIVADLPAIDAKAFVDSFKVGGSVEAGAKAGAAKDRFEKCRRRAFAIGAGNVGAGVGALGTAKAVGEDAYIFEIEFGRGRLRGRGEFAAEGEKIANRGVVIHLKSKADRGNC